MTAANTSTATILTIYTSREAANTAAPAANTTNAPRLIEVFKRNPTKYAGVWLDVNSIPNTDSVPTQYRAIIDAAITKAVKAIIDDHAFSGTYEPSWIPVHKLSTEAILAATAQSATTWLTKEEVATGWTQSATYKTFQTKMLTLEPAQRKGYLKAMELYGEAINKLSAKSVRSISPEQATTMLAKLADADLSTAWGEFVAGRLGTIAAREEPEAFDLDSL